MIYTVADIEEDLDFGCEERPEGEKTKAIVVLEYEGEMTRLVQEDEMLRQRGIEVGTQVSVDEKGCLVRSI